ncbi:unnamed protein product [Acanthoscelides obtectus]|uniref:Uncharacterized protein n=1 Tax=Acanthoscelides obtectus TaxID=200917 RepID=A0A9P0Q7H3_ACAOB|nr:unnamed protein product [Acanthoscelides obtectus]CAK1672320.1 hypothetical protein AOBTE_LOCUS28785 [Acanthoscelides obtectus]
MYRAFTLYLGRSNCGGNPRRFLAFRSLLFYLQKKIVNETGFYYLRKYIPLFVYVDTTTTFVP